VSRLQRIEIAFEVRQQLRESRGEMVVLATLS
jgi:hypothetical protein